MNISSRFEQTVDLWLKCGKWIKCEKFKKPFKTAQNAFLH